MNLIHCLSCAMKKKSIKKISLLVEYVKNGIYHSEYKVFTKKEYEKMLKQSKKESLC